MTGWILVRCHRVVRYYPCAFKTRSVNKYVTCIRTMLLFLSVGGFLLPSIWYGFVFWKVRVPNSHFLILRHTHTRLKLTCLLPTPFYFYHATPPLKVCNELYFPNWPICISFLGVQLKSVHNVIHITNAILTLTPPLLILLLHANRRLWNIRNYIVECSIYATWVAFWRSHVVPGGEGCLLYTTILTFSM